MSTRTSSQTQASKSSVQFGETISIKGGATGNVVNISNVVVTDSSYSNTSGFVSSGGYIKLYGSGFQANTVVTVNANTIPQANITYFNSNQLNIALPTIANTTVVIFSAYNPPANTSYSYNASAVIVQYLVVAGGGAGGYNRGGGGGAGGLLHGCFTAITSPSTSYTIQIGAGGSAPASCGAYGGNGSSSNIASPTLSIINAIGGGAGGSETASGSNSGHGSGLPGGSGGGGVAYNGGTPGSGATGTPGQGNSGGNGDPSYGGSGGGAGGAGNPGPIGVGGSGYTWPYTANTYAGGGGGGYNPLGTGGPGGGGSAGFGNGTNGSPGTTNTGGGGGGAGGGPNTGGAGGPGVVILTYHGPQQFTGGTVTTPPAAPGYTVHTFNSSGTLTYGYIA